ncbi:TPA: ABC transporter ATP-binding protein [Clostridium botulinum]|uniref:ABC transporter ATP-binding protein n=1 Tax=Clostridium botulinum TaxID=1491 RepID=UPI0007E1154C|nr:ABC transporter ATP-binding protein [Clostridium botulinum]APQ75980.1 ABC transporter family protein [Clostridium botulinum]AUM98330.1 multidrug ABC transporter ATP-binding protein [Clostridium botulinum]KEI80238.1 multidrug ABC transporter ATP-binding protein [Clostridium botulinum B2 331]MBN3354857.1 ABC transporter ATP-binding protein [Clostridium botulinum]MBY7002933.1 ABC transporter ATP-binding protein [Clostridium botulinum]
MNAINIENLKKSYDGQTNALSNISLSIPKGEIFGFLGPNGSGKTTTVRILNGVLSATSGYAEILGIPVGKNNLEIHRLCGVMTESSSCYENLTAKENLIFFGKMHGIEEKLLNERTNFILKRLELLDVKDKKVKSFSTGMRKRISLAIALIHDPQILFLDEPTSGLDPENALNVTRLIKELAAENQVTIFLCTHQLKYAEDICTLYGFINNGNILGLGTFDELASRKNAILKLKIRGKNISKEFGFIHEGNDIYNKSISGDKEVNTLIRNILTSGGEIYEAVQQKWSLEQLYFKYIKGTSDDVKL